MVVTPSTPSARRPGHAHGTSIVGALAARARLRGTAPGAHILLARAFGTHRSSMMARPGHRRGVDWAMQRNARMINMSFAGDRDPPSSAIVTAARRAASPVAAAGNAGPTAAPLYPAALPGSSPSPRPTTRPPLPRGGRGSHSRSPRRAWTWLRRSVATAGSPRGPRFRPPKSPADRADAGAQPSHRGRSASGAGLDRPRPRSPGIDPLFGAGLMDAYQAVLVGYSAGAGPRRPPRPPAGRRRS